MDQGNSKDLKIAAIGGGTGLSTMLRGLRSQFNEITAIVSVADDGGSSGILRREYNMLPPGDIRNCISALTDTDTAMRELLNFRFGDGPLKGHTTGNLILAALYEMQGSFEAAVDQFSKLFVATGNVVPVTGESVTLSALMEDGALVKGESLIGGSASAKRRIRRVFLTPEKPKPCEAAIEALRRADVIVLGPGSLYTSIIPNLLADEICETIRESRAKKIYVCNVMTQPGETNGYTAYDHLKALEAHSFRGIVDYMLVNTQALPELMLKKYRADGSEPVIIDEERFDGHVKLVRASMMLVRNEYVRHNFSRLSRAIRLIAEMKE